MFTLLIYRYIYNSEGVQIYGLYIYIYIYYVNIIFVFLLHFNKMDKY